MDWSELKARLIDAGALDACFRAAADTAAADSEGDEYEPLLFENLLRDLTGHLDRALSYRREMRELEVQAVKAAAEYQLFKGQSRLDLELGLLQLREREKQTLLATHQSAATSFGADSALAKGFAGISTGTATQYEQEIADTRAEAQLLRDRHRELNAYQDAYQARHDEPGNAHNYAERSRALGELLAQDWRYAVAKARAAYTGFQMLFGRRPADLPSLSRPDSLDALVLWVREIIEAAALEAQAEAEFDVVVPLVQATKYQGASLISPNDFARAVAETKEGRKPLVLEFELGSLYFGASNLRLRRVGLAYGTMIQVGSSDLDRAGTFNAYCRYRATIRTPVRRRPPVCLGAVSVYGAPLAYSDGGECFNVNPVGRWRIEVDPIPVYKSAEGNIWISNGPEDKPWVDVKLFLTVRARPA